MKKFIKTVGIAVAIAATMAPMAAATSGPAMLQSRAPIGTASNTGAISGNASSYGTHIFTVGSAQVRCVDATFKVTSVATASATIDPSYSGCVLAVGGLNVPATVHSSCGRLVDFFVGVGDNVLGKLTGGRWTLNCHTITVPAISCTLTLFAQTRSSVTLQNITAAGGNDTSASPWGSSITDSVTGLTYTTITHSGGNCVIPEHGVGTFSGTVAVRNVWGSL